MKRYPAGHLLLPAMAGLLLPLAAAGAAPPREELSAVHAKLEALQKDLATNRDRHAAALAALRQSEQSIEAISRRLSALDQERTTIGAERAATVGALEALTSRIRQQQAELGRILAAQYRAGEPEGVQRLLGGDDRDSLHRDLGYLQYIGRERGRLIRNLRDSQAQLNLLAARQADQDRHLARIRDAQAAARLDLEQERRNRQQLLAAVSRQISAQEHEIHELQKDEKRLSALVEKLAKPLPSPTAAPKPAPSVRPPAATAPAEPGATLVRGALRRPVDGRYRNRFGAPREGGGTTWRGLFFEARAGSPVRAVAAGRVVYANWLRGFGNLIILDHGNGLMSLYGNGDVLLRAAGRQVQAGEVLARVGNSGSDGPGLYFELRQHSVPLDPAPWLGAN